jgi:hypothetical protein
LEGSLLLTSSGRKSKNHFRIISYNAANWEKLSENDKFKPLLGLLGNGYIKAGSNIAGIDTTNPLIERFNNAIKYSCAKTKLDDSKKKGDIKMLSFFRFAHIIPLHLLQNQQVKYTAEPLYLNSPC